MARSNKVRNRKIVWRGNNEKGMRSEEKLISNVVSELKKAVSLLKIKISKTFLFSLILDLVTLFP